MAESLRQGTGDRKIAVGVAGCGRMGLPMARALARADINVIGFDVRSGDAFPDMAMEFDAAAFMRPLTHLISVVRDQAQTEALLFDTQALLAHPSALEVLIVSSTLPPAYIADLRRRIPDHITLIDAPMSGASVAAEDARLTFMLGGEAEDIDGIQLLLAAMGDRFHHMGPLGAGMTAKVLNNLVAAASMAATRTAMDWAGPAGIDPDHLLAVMNDSSGQTWISSGFDAIEFARDGFEQGNSIETIVKDIAAAQTLCPDETDLIEALSQTLQGLQPLTD